MTKYSLQVSNDGENFQYYKEQDQATNKVPYNSENKPLCLKDPPYSLPHPRTPETAFSQAKRYDFKTKTFAMIVKPINCNMVY